MARSRILALQAQYGFRSHFPVGRSHAQSLSNPSRKACSCLACFDKMKNLPMWEVFHFVRALGFEPRTFRVSVECSTN